MSRISVLTLTMVALGCSTGGSGRARDATFGPADHTQGLDGEANGGQPELLVSVDGVATDHVTLASVDPTEGDPEIEVHTVELKNIGSAPAMVTHIGLLATNPDGTDPNPAVQLRWLGGFDPVLHLPVELEAHGGELSFQVIYEPICVHPPCNLLNAATLQLRSDDPQAAVTQITFAPSPCPPAVRAEPAEVTFYDATVAKPEKKTIELINDGACEDRVLSCGFSAPTSTFSLSQDWPDGEVLQPGEPLAIVVTYSPATGGATDQARIECLVESQSAPLVITLSAVVETGSFEVSYPGQENGYLDFTATTSGCAQEVVTIFNEGPAVLELKKVSIPEDTAGTHYDVECAFAPTSSDGLPTPIPVYPVALGPNRSIDCTVQYCSSTAAGLNATLLIEYDHPEPGSREIPLMGAP